jgi:hypothetical protein
MTTISTYRNSKVSGGVERSFESIDVRHPLFPVALYLVRERFYNSHRHGAKQITLVFRKLRNTNFLLEVRDTSDGNADVNRLLEPAEESGMTSSQYGFGERIWRLKASGRHLPSRYAWKKSGDMFYTVLDQMNGKYTTAPVNLTSEGIWTKPDEHGFYSKMEFLADRLEGRSSEEIVAMIRCILCMSLTPEVLNSLTIRIEVRDEDGDLLKETVPPGKPTKNGKPRKMREPRVVGLGDSKEDKWKSLVQVIRENPLADPVTATGTLSTHATIQIEYCRLKPCGTKRYYDGLKEYTEKKSSAVLVEMHGFVVPIQLPEALGKAAHPASQNGRFAIITIRPPTLPPTEASGKSALEIEHLHQRTMPTLASSKVTFLGTCPVYQEMINFLRMHKPSHWDAFVKKSSDSESSPNPVPDFTPLPDPTPSLLHAKLMEVLALLRLAPMSDERIDLQGAIELYISP